MAQAAGDVRQACLARQDQVTTSPLLGTQLKDGERKFRVAGELALLQLLKRFDGLPGTKMAGLMHGISHEEYHRAQIAVYARLMGREPALTRVIRGG